MKVNFTLHGGTSLKGRLVGISELCGALGGVGHDPLTKMAISQFVQDGMPKAARGKYNLEACAIWYIGRLRTANQKRASETEDGKLVSLDEAERRLKLAKAEAEEMTLAERRGELMPVHLHESMLTSVVQVTKQRILNVPTRLAAKLEGCTTIEIKALLNASLRDALAEISRKEATRAEAAKSDAPTDSGGKATRSGNARGSKPRKP